MKKKLDNPKVEVKPISTIVPKEHFLSNKPLLLFTVKSMLFVFIIAIAIFYSDMKGYFNPDETKNHTKKKWDVFYELSKEINVDVLMLGNSHLYTGINPENLCTNLGVNAFILASPGTNISDTYFALKEALKSTKPKLIIIETYGFFNFNPYELEGDILSNQLKSFSARKDFITKLISTPYLFHPKNYPYAWSNTLRNHNFIFTNPEQIELNKMLMDQVVTPHQGLYLGRYVRFQTGIEPDNLAKYETDPAPLNGEDYNYSKYTVEYADKIVALCKQQNIPLLFVTVPMYSKHIGNYAAWKDKLGEILYKYESPWLNFQDPYDYERFTPMCFENTFVEDQHLTYNGSLIVSYKLADYIRNEMQLDLPNRKTEDKWISMFYGQDGYFDFNPVSPNDPVNSLLANDLTINDLSIKEVALLGNVSPDFKVLQVKVSKGNLDLSKCSLKVEVNLTYNNQTGVSFVDLQYDPTHETSAYYLFKSMINPLQINQVISISAVCP